MTEPAAVPAKTPTESPATMRTPAHGRGRLRVGGTNRGGPGRPPSVLRALAREQLDHCLPVLDAIAGNRKARGSDRIAAIALLGRIGMTQAISIADVRAALELTGAEIRGMLPADQAEQLIARIRVHWMRL